MSTDCHIYFKVQVQTHINEHVRVCGNIQQLGTWNYTNGYVLSTDPASYPIWYNEQPLVLPRNTKLEFKFVIIKNDSVNQWETLPQNRKYRARYCRVILKADWNNPDGRELVEKKFKSSIYLDESKKTNIKTIKKQRFSQEFNPFAQDDSDSDSDENSSNQGWGDSFSKIDDEEDDLILGDIPVHKVKKIHNIQTTIPEEVEEEKIISTKHVINRSQKSNLKSAHSTLDENSFEGLYQNYPENIRLKTFLSTPFSENDILYELNQEQLISFSEKDHVYLLSFYLPFQIKYDREKKTIEFRMFEFSFNHHLFRAFKDMNCQKKWIGIPTIYDENLVQIKDLNDVDKQTIENYLKQELESVPIFIDPEELKLFNEKFYSQLYQPVMDNDVCVTIISSMEYSNELYDSFIKINQYFTQKILLCDSNVIQTKEQQSFTVIVDQRLTLVPIQVSRDKPHMPLAIFYNRFFPSFENFQLLPFYEEIIFLISTVICFANYNTAANFISLISQKFNLEFSSQKGSLSFKYLGREIQIKLRSPGIELPSNTVKDSKTLRNAISGSGLILAGVDILGFHQGVQLKLKLYKKFVHDSLDLIRNKKIKLIQIVTPAIEESRPDQSIRELEELVLEINSIAYPKNDDWCVQIIYDKGNKAKYNQDIHFLLQNAHIYLQSHFSGNHDFFLSEYIYLNRFPRAMISNSSCFNKTFMSVIKYNLFNYQEFKQKLYDEILFSVNKPHDLIHIISSKIQSDKQQIQNSKTQNWLEGTILDLKKAHSQLKFAEITLIQQNNMLKKVAHSPKFKHLNITKLKKSYVKCAKKVIVIEFHSLLVGSQAIVDISTARASEQIRTLFLCENENFSIQYYYNLNAKLLNALQQLALKNSVYIVSSGTQRELDKSLQACYGLNLFAENGYCYKTQEMKTWAKLFRFDPQSLNLVYRTMQGYMYRTEGSSLEVKESMVTWKYGEQLQEFGKKQSKDLIETLHGILERFQNLEITTCRNSVEVKPAQLNKGILLDLILQKETFLKGKIDCLICIGRPIQDEDMFGQFRIMKNHMQSGFIFDEFACQFSISNELLPSNASYFLKDQNEIIELIHQLSQ